MSQIFGFGSTLVTDRALDRMPTGQIRKSAGGTSVATSPVKADFTPIGLGKPLSIEIAYVYAGELAASGWLLRRPDLLVTSAVKRLPIFDAAPRAVNALVRQVEENFQYPQLPAVEKGTPLVYYTPALTDRGTVVTLEMTFDRFSKDTLEQVGSMLSSAASIPVFAPANAFLMAAGVLTKIGASIAEGLFDGRPSFGQTVTINLNRPGLRDTPPGYSLLTDSDEIEELIEKEELYVDVERGGLVHVESKEAYDGPGAYIILSFDGAVRDDYEDFGPTIASAATLDRFLHTGEQRPSGTRLLLDAMQAYNDLHYRSQIGVLYKRLQGVSADSEDGKYLQVLIDAYTKNIRDENLRP